MLAISHNSGNMSSVHVCHKPTLSPSWSPTEEWWDQELCRNRDEPWLESKACLGEHSDVYLLHSTNRALLPIHPVINSLFSCFSFLSLHFNLNWVYKWFPIGPQWPLKEAYRYCCLIPILTKIQDTLMSCSLNEQKCKILPDRMWKVGF